MINTHIANYKLKGITWVPAGGQNMKLVQREVVYSGALSGDKQFYTPTGDDLNVWENVSFFK